MPPIPEQQEEVTTIQNNNNNNNINNNNNPKTKFSSSSTSSTSPSPSPPSNSFLPGSSEAIDYRLQQCPRDAHHPITVLAKHRVREGDEHYFYNWVNEITTFQNLHYPGYLGSEVIRPVNCEYKNEYISIFRYDTYENLSRWMHSKDRQRRMELVQQYLENELLVTYHSLEHWFVRPADVDDDDENDGTSIGSKKTAGSGNGGNVPPPQYKMVIVVFLVIWFQLHFILPHTIWNIEALSPLGAEGIGTLLVTILTTYVFMPIVTRVFSFWLFPGKPYLATLKELIPRPILKMMKKRKQTREAQKEEEEEDGTIGIENGNKTSIDIATTATIKEEEEEEKTTKTSQKLSTSFGEDENSEDDTKLVADAV